LWRGRRRPTDGAGRPRPPSIKQLLPRAFDREQALNTAMDLFWRHGHEGTSTAQLTAAVGIAPPSQ
jgi:AcrR family transcriptional regulator